MIEIKDNYGETKVFNSEWELERYLTQYPRYLGCIPEDKITERMCIAAASADRETGGPALKDVPESIKQSSQEFWNRYAQNNTMNATFYLRQIPLKFIKGNKIIQGYVNNTIDTIRSCSKYDLSNPKYRERAKKLFLFQDDGYHELYGEVDREIAQKCHSLKEIIDYISQHKEQEGFQSLFNGLAKPTFYSLLNELADMVPDGELKQQFIEASGAVAEIVPSIKNLMEQKQDINEKLDEISKAKEAILIKMEELNSKLAKLNGAEQSFRQRIEEIDMTISSGTDDKMVNLEEENSIGGMKSSR